ncbi:MAG: DUF4157 domain-containing protein [Nitrososphaerota archaeon]
MSTRAYTRASGRRKPLTDDEKTGLGLGFSSHEQDSVTSLAPENDPALTSTAGGAGHDFGQVAVLPAPDAASQMPQMKLRISQPGDKHEQEADAVAEQVLRVPDAEVDAAASSHAQATVTPTSEAALAVPEGGQPLDAEARAFMEPRFGHDFSQVRVHADAPAAEAAASFGARAYTVGSDIVFGAREYAPGSSEGQRLIAHELTHVVQQQTDLAAASTVQREPDEGTQAPETAPEGLPDTIQDMSGKAGDAKSLRDDRLILHILDMYMSILDNWKAGLDDFSASMNSVPGKVEASGYFGVIAEVFVVAGLGLVGENLGLVYELGKGVVNVAEKVADAAFKLKEQYAKANEAAEMEEKNKEKVAVSAFYTRHNDLIVNLKNKTRDSRELLAQYVKGIQDAAAPALDDGAHKRTKGKVKRSRADEQKADAAIEAYEAVHMSLLDASDAISAREEYWTPNAVVRALSESWINQSESEHVIGDELGEGKPGKLGGILLPPNAIQKHASRIIIYLNRDYSARDAYIEAYGGKELGDTLLTQVKANGQDGVDLWHLRVPHTIVVTGAGLDQNGWPDLHVDFDPDGNLMTPYDSQGIAMREEIIKLERHIKTNGVPLIKKFRGDE